jgi:hypothetical protein
MGKAHIVDIFQALVLDLEKEDVELVIAMLFRVNVCRYWGEGRGQWKRNGSGLKLVFQSLLFIRCQLVSYLFTDRQAASV